MIHNNLLSTLVDELKVQSLELLDLSVSIQTYLYLMSLRFQFHTLVLWKIEAGELFYLESFGLSRKDRRKQIQPIAQTELLASDTTWPWNLPQNYAHEIVILGNLHDEFALSIVHNHNATDFNTIRRALLQIAPPLSQVLSQRYQQTQNQSISKRLQSVLDAAKDGIFILSHNGHIVEWNASAAKLLGLHNRDLNGLELAPLMFEKNILKKFMVWYQRLQAGKIKEIYQELKGLNDKIFEINVSSIPFSSPTLFMVHFRDITEKKQINTYLKETKARLQTMIDNFQGGILMENMNNQILLVNQAFCQMFDLPDSPQMLVGQPTEDVLNEMARHFVNISQFKKDIQHHYNKKAVSLDEVFALRNSEYIELDYVPVKSDRSLIGHLWVYRDATDKIKNSEDLEILSRFPGEDPNPVMRISDQGEVLYANIPAKYLLHYWHRDVGDFVPGFIQEHVEGVLQQSNTKTLELAFGRRRYQVVMVPFAKNQYVNLYATDITARKAAEAEALKARDMAVSASETKSIFLATMSHEIRTPLNAILGMIDVVLSTTLDQEQRHYLNISRQAGHNLLSLINTLLDFSRIEAGKIEFERVPFQVVPLMEQTIGVFSVRAQETGIKLKLKYPEQRPEWFMGDGRRLSQIMFILIDNALKFTHQGSITLEWLNAYQEAEQWHLSFQVKDTGIGIPEAKQNAIFESFQQADSSTTRKYGGSGLGLSIASQLTRLFGGRIQLESQEGKGSSFRFYVTLGNPSEAEIATAQDENYVFQPQNFFQKEKTQSKKILIVEDSPENRMLMKAYFKHTPLQIRFAHNGKEAVECWQEYAPDLILMDIQMPEMDGFTATGILRTEGAEMPILALTADALESTKEKCLQIGFSDVLTKPIQQAKLFYAIDLYLTPEQDAENETGREKTADSPVAENPIDLNINYSILDSLQDLIPFFWEQRLADIPLILENLAQENWEVLQRTGHSLKGSGSSYGFPQFTELGIEFENAAKAQNLQALNAVFQKIKDYIQACEGVLKNKGYL